MDSSGPILVKTAVPEEEIVEGSRTVTQEQRILSVEVLSSVVENTADLRENLNKFINGLNSKIQSV